MSEIILIGHSGNRVPVVVGSYSDATPMVKLDDCPLYVKTMVIRHTSAVDFLAAMFLVDSIWQRGGTVENLVLPYFPGARQDRINLTGDNLFAASSFAEMINTRGFF